MNNYDSRKNRINLPLNIILLFLAILMSLGAAVSCCLTNGYGLGDIVYMIPLWVLSIAYFLIVIIRRKTIFKSIIPPLIFGIILGFFVLNLIFNRGSECPCDLF